MIDFEKDLEVFLDTRHFAQEFEVVGVGTVIKGIFQSPFQGLDMLGQAVNTKHVTLTVKTSDVVACNLKRKVRVRKLTDNSIWQIKEQQEDELGDDSTGMTVLVIGESIE